MACNYWLVIDHVIGSAWGRAALCCSASLRRRLWSDPAFGRRDVVCQQVR